MLILLQLTAISDSANRWYIYVLKLLDNIPNFIFFLFPRQYEGDDSSSGGDEDGEEPSPSCGDYIMHFLTLFWKILFAFIPPTGMYFDVRYMIADKRTLFTCTRACEWKNNFQCVWFISRRYLRWIPMLRCIDFVHWSGNRCYRRCCITLRLHARYQRFSDSHCICCSWNEYSR